MQVTVGSLLSRSFNTLMKNFPVFFVIAVIFNIPTLLVEWFVVPELSARVGQVVSQLTSMVVGGLVASALMYGVVESLRGGSASLAACMQTAFAHFLPVMVISFIYGVGVALGTLLLIVPGIIIACIWYVAVPAQVVERSGILGSFTRSADLTRGHRMTLFLTALVFFAIIFGVTMLVLVPTVGGAAELADATADATAPSLFVLLVTLGLAVTVGLWGQVAMGVAYHDLRVNKEGVSTEEIANVFA